MGRGWAAAWRMAERQAGVIGRAQAFATGLRPWQATYQLETGARARVAPATYRLAGAPRTFEQRLHGMQLWAGNGSLFSHATAARLWGFTRFERRDDVHLTLRTRQRTPDAEVTLHQVAYLEARETGSARGFRVTSVSRTLLDLAATEPWPSVRAAVDEAVRRRWLSLDRLSVTVERAAGRRGVRPLRELVDEYAGGSGPSESELEARVIEFLEEHRIPAPRRQQRVVIGGRCRRIDFVWPERRLIIEADGYAWHADLASFERDRQRRSALTARGFRVLQWTWKGVLQRPDTLVAEFWRTWQQP